MAISAGAFLSVLTRPRAVAIAVPMGEIIVLPKGIALKIY
jgi:hypothetical protein